MNKKVFIAMLILTISFLVSFYILKIFFPQEFLLVIENDRLIQMGLFIDKRIWLRHICEIFTSFATYWLFLCACKRKMKLNFKECLAILCAIITVKVVAQFDFNLSRHLSICSFFLLPMILSMDLKVATKAYFVHGFAQIVSLSIRSLPLYLKSINFMTSLIMCIDGYIWLILLYIIFNYKKENKNEN